MKTVCACFTFLVLVGTGPAAAQGRAPAELEAARKAFASAVQANDRTAVEALTAFPLKNDVYQQPKTISQTRFKDQFNMYREHLVKCIRGTPLTRVQGAWQIDCDGNILHFGKKGTKWLHTGFENANE